MGRSTSWDEFMSANWARSEPPPNYEYDRFVVPVRRVAEKLARKFDPSDPHLSGELFGRGIEYAILRFMEGKAEGQRLAAITDPKRWAWKVRADVERQLAAGLVEQRRGAAEDAYLTANGVSRRKVAAQRLRDGDPEMWEVVRLLGNPKEREVLTLAYRAEGLNDSQIAELLGEHVRAVETRRRRAVRRVASTVYAAGDDADLSWDCQEWARPASGPVSADGGGRSKTPEADWLGEVFGQESYGEDGVNGYMVTGTP